MESPFTIATRRLQLFAPSSAEIAELRSGERTGLGSRIGATISEEWWLGPTLVRLLLGLPEKMAQEPGDARWVWLVIEPITANVVGDIGFHGPMRDDATVEIGYSIIPRAQRFGYATEAASALIHWTFAHTRVAQIIAQINPGNAPSLRVAAKLGMQQLPPISTEYLCFGITRPPT
ncbi:MAG TPA: GNAT family N-acetyltransferase [Ktedonobacterales bacterium]|nr:GNAT family N-acetyltransferase [Ktedonobacterales bacterium]